jgi:hypothetical protein
MHTREQHLAMISDPSRWPCWPFLPLKRPKAGGTWPPDMGLLWAGSGGLTVHACNLLVVPPTAAEFRSLPSQTYASAEEMLDDGWLVD